MRRRTQQSPEGWRRVRRIFDVALVCAAGKRHDLVAGRCGGDAELRRQVESLLAAHDAAGTFIETPLIDAPLIDAATVAPDADAVPGARIGPYRLEHLLERGGMGAVYLAKRVDREFEENVAVKVLQRGMETEEAVRRFRGERRILARLEHPNIARLIDGGSTADGRPFLVMEHVDGKPIDRYCDDERLSITARLRLFLDVCRAVHYAHRSLVVHRDLKPSNILVTAAGEPKLLDFGIAKLLDREAPLTVTPTEPGRTPMTPEYASPEQVRGERITVASDVYSLGVLLYRLLAGRPPYRIGRRAPAEIERLVCRHDPPWPSSVEHRLRGDIDHIVMKALRKEPEARYASVERMAEDVRRHLARLPVGARRGSFRYRARRILRRGRLGVGVTAALLLVAWSSATLTALRWRRLARPAAGRGS